MAHQVSSYLPLKYPLHVHKDVLGWRRDDSIKRRVTLALQQLGSAGKTTNIKGVSGSNAGWLRTPLGGNSGYQFYLWWKRLVDSEGRNACLVRCIRHHDDHSLLNDRPDECVELPVEDLLADDLLPTPWTKQQIAAQTSLDRFKLIIGKPGSGKTTILWRAIEAVEAQRVLYITWSQDLARVTEQRLQSFTPKSVTYEVNDWSTFLANFGVTYRPRSMSDCVSEWRGLLGKLTSVDRGVWNGWEEGLYAEVRAHVLGHPDMTLPNVLDGEGFDSYVNRRRAALGDRAARQVGSLIRKLRKTTWAESCFPELVAARNALERVRAGDLPQPTEINLLVVDEIQDLTLVESEILVDFCRLHAGPSNRQFRLVMAGDEAQIVRPTGFDWGLLKNQFRAVMGEAGEFQLDESLRCPERIAKVIDRLSDTVYPSIQKKYRPGVQGESTSCFSVEAKILYANANSIDVAVSCLRRLSEIEGLGVVSPDGSVPNWVPEDQRHHVLPPHVIKGLEYQTVVVLNAGEVLDSLSRPHHRKQPELDQLRKRTLVDQLRVSMSRATESLVFFDVEAAEERAELSRDTLTCPAEFDPRELPDELSHSEVDAVDRVNHKTARARQLLAEAPATAWSEILQACQLLGNPGLPNGIADPVIRDEALDALFSIAARLVLDLPVGFTRDKVHDPVINFAHRYGKRNELDRFDTVLAFCEPGRDSIPMLTARASRDDLRWFSETRNRLRATLRESLSRLASLPEQASRFEGSVEAWVEEAYGSPQPNRAMQLREQAFDTLLSTGRLEQARRVLDTIKPKDWKRSAQCSEASREYGAAASSFAKAGQFSDAARNARMQGDWTAAVAYLRKGDTLDETLLDSEWLLKLDKLIERCPADLHRRLTDGDRGRLRQLLRTHTGLDVG